jgi:hypothetical protein
MSEKRKERKERNDLFLYLARVPHRVLAIIRPNPTQPLRIK